MEQTEQLHTQAMEYADQADVARHRGDAITMIQLFQQAFKAECAAAELLATEYNMEPTRSILYRSAASLALDCEEYREAERLLCKGLAGNPPEEIVAELRDQYERVNFERHLEVRGVTLAPTDIQLVLAGDGVDFGTVPGGVRNAAFHSLCGTRRRAGKSASLFQDKKRQVHAHQL